MEAKKAVTEQTVLEENAGLSEEDRKRLVASITLENSQFSNMIMSILEKHKILETADIEQLTSQSFCLDKFHSSYPILKEVSDSKEDVTLQIRDRTGRTRYYGEIYDFKGRKFVTTSQLYGLQKSSRNRDNRTPFYHWVLEKFEIPVDEENPNKSGLANSWIVSWNPNNWHWEDYASAIQQTRNGQAYSENWSCYSKKPKIGDRVYLLVLGQKQYNGIVAAGYVERESLQEEHWDTEKMAQGEKVNKIGIQFDRILDYKTSPILQQDSLSQKFPNQQWSPQASGIEIKQQYAERLEDEWQKLLHELDGVAIMTRKEQLNHIKSYIASEGFSYNDGLIENFYLSLKTKPFVILAGISGTGKTRLVRLFAEAVGASAENGRFKLVAVRPDWSDSSDLFGHVDLNGKFLPGAILDFVKQAGEDLEKPYFLCLDEMNLARVEYYLSDVLSIMETRDRNEDGEIVTDPLLGRNLFGSDENAIEEYGNLRIPENLYIIGTVNMDETTFPFSKKVLDRANTLEFSHVDLKPMENGDLSKKPETLNVPNEFLKTEYLRLKDCDREDGIVDALCSELEALNTILKQSNAQVGYRVRDEFVFYFLNNRAQQLLSDDEAKDNEILQKILPRIHGSTSSVKRMLCELFKLCAGDFDSLQTENNEAGEKMEKRLSSGGARYPNSARKIAFMVRSFEENGFTSFWLQ